jgi:M3 family oligoendopeptidase
LSSADFRTADFRTYKLPTPAYDAIAREYAELEEELKSASSGDAAIAVVEKWDLLRRRLSTWNQLVLIRFSQDTRNEDFKRTREYRDDLEPKLTNLAVAFKKRLIASPHRDAIAQHFGEHAFALWRCDVASFEPAIEADLAEQSKLEASYTELVASAKLEFRGETLTLTEIVKYDEHPDRSVRHEAARVRWGWYDEHRAEFDEIFDKLVQLRHSMALKLGFKNYVEFAYVLMHRVDYGQAEVERFREQVRTSVVPLVAENRLRQAERLGVDQLMAWDEGLLDPAGNPQPRGDAEWMMDRATEMFGELGPGIDEFFHQMRDGNLMDLVCREGKGGGGYCTGLPDFGLPFIFANFNGTMHDVGVFTHEMGHAYQNHSSRHQPLEDYLWPTMEACEIHSMGLEFLTWPQMELFFGDGAERFRWMHLTQKLAVIAYIAAVDHFQHLVYAKPTASVDERAAMWQGMERLYLPWLDWGNLAYPASGRRWQAQLHIYRCPFYYIDYALALVCAMQLWVRAETDRAGAMASYELLCRRGGEAAFVELATSAGLTSPFDAGCLERVVAQAERVLKSP